jgi:diadenosine tetraphosphate (Ap4A) HIT family hydrolase
MTSDCYPCAMNAQIDTLPPRESVAVTGYWRVAHAFNSTLAGWLVVIPRSHVGAFEELPEQAAQELGVLLHRCSVALRRITGCSKSYFMFYAEAEGFTHLHIHLVPRMPDFTAEQLGPAVFSWLSAKESEWLTEADRDAFALQMRSELAPS